MTVAALLAAIALHVPIVGDVDVQLTGCHSTADATACAQWDGRTIEMDPTVLAYTRVAAQTLLGHELGHLWDMRNLTDADRQQLARLLHAPPGPWWWDGVSALQLQHDPPAAERFADAYGLCGLGPLLRSRVRSQGRYIGEYGETLTSRQVAVVCWYVHTHTKGATP